MYYLLQALCFRLLLPVSLLRRQSFCGKARQGSLTIICPVVLVWFCAVAAATGAETAVKGEFRGSGELIIVSPGSLTVVVDVVEGSRQRIIGAKLAADAILLKGDRKSDLRSFHVGEKVKVAWKVTDHGREIIALLSQQTPAASASAHQTKPAAQPKHIKKIAVAKNLRSQPSQPLQLQAILGKRVRHVVDKEETLLDIARTYDLGYNELVDLYPEYDPWLPPVGQELLLPTERLLPDSARKGIVINIPELRLYYFSQDGQSSLVTTHPVGIGDAGYPTLPGNYTVGNKVINPTWFIPPSLRPKYKVSSIPPGPYNPLGKYWLGLKGTMYGIHGTDIPWSVGRTVTHGCIRMYPEDIQRFFPTIQPGTPVQLIYEPVKIARIADSFFIEVHGDIYGRIDNLAVFAQKKAVEKGVWHLVDQERFMAAVQSRKGIPVNVTMNVPPDRRK